MLKAVVGGSSGGSATGVTAAAVLTANQLVVGDDGARGIKTANATITGNYTFGGTVTLSTPLAAGSGGTGFSTQLSSTVTFIIDGGGAAITTGIKGDLTVPFGHTITQWTLLADQSGSIVLDIWNDTYANYPPTIADTITAAAKPTISTAVKGQSSTLTGWTTAIPSGNTYRFNVDSITTIQRVTLSLTITRTSAA